MTNLEVNTSSFNITSYCVEILRKGPPEPATVYFSEDLQIILCSVMILITVATFLDNSVVVASIIIHKSLRTKTNGLVVSLAIADLCIALGPMPLSIFLTWIDKDYKVGTTVCLIMASLDNYLCSVSILQLSFLALDRYISITKPFLYERIGNRAIFLMVLVCWIFPIFLSFLPILTKWYRVDLEEWHACVKPSSHAMGHCPFFANKTYSLIVFVFFVASLLVMLFCYSIIFKVARKQASQIRSLTVVVDKRAEKHLKQELKAAKSIGILVVTFSVCWIPSVIVTLVNPFIGYTVSDVVYGTTLWLAYTNSMLNPLLYYLSHRPFKKAVRKTLRLWKEKNSVLFNNNQAIEPVSQNNCQDTPL
ncbi:trace amine-associated receptor 1-like [Gigantopelta aegis]|uniref:trace amine-associated receptor 1-like n=1 Tax=Gigantopelta aegis TaxID=1735272 RepID=UPI001B88DF7D|nr:trace amine-associated receptor 1-like [Gigantopelta aegis]